MHLWLKILAKFAICFFLVKCVWSFWWLDSNLVYLLRQNLIQTIGQHIQEVSVCGEKLQAWSSNFHWLNIKDRRADWIASWILLSLLLLLFYLQILKVPETALRKLSESNLVICEQASNISALPDPACQQRQQQQNISCKSPLRNSPSQHSMLIAMHKTLARWPLERVFSIAVFTSKLAGHQCNNTTHAWLLSVTQQNYCIIPRWEKPSSKRAQQLDKLQATIYAVFLFGRVGKATEK